MVTKANRLSWQANRLIIAKIIAKQMPLSELISYSDYLKANITVKPGYGKDIMMVAKAIEIKVGGA